MSAGGTPQKGEIKFSDTPSGSVYEIGVGIGSAYEIGVGIGSVYEIGVGVGSFYTNAYFIYLHTHVICPSLGLSTVSDGHPGTHLGPTQDPTRLWFEIPKTMV